jgi:hypothetical protein
LLAAAAAIRLAPPLFFAIATRHAAAVDTRCCCHILRLRFSQMPADIYFIVYSAPAMLAWLARRATRNGARYAPCRYAARARMSLNTSQHAIVCCRLCCVAQRCYDMLFAPRSARHAACRAALRDAVDFSID